MLSDNYLDELNPAQREAVLYCDGPSLVIAGAGSGKTRVLTYKIAHLLRLGMKPWNILALTFTNKAADEMKSRIARQVGEESAHRLWMGTFHSIFARILRAESQLIGFTSNFTIYDATDSKSLIKSITKQYIEREIVIKQLTNAQIENLKKKYDSNYLTNRISWLKNRLISPDEYVKNKEFLLADARNGIENFYLIYKDYIFRCRQADALDFDDILLFTYFLFAHYPDVLLRYENRFQYILVDEYQDTNYVQHAIILQLTQHNRRLCVVGDDAQSIYSFRGADINNILTFQKIFHDARLFKLEQNYRSTQTIVEAANSVIRHNQGQIPKLIFSEKSSGSPIYIYNFFSDLEEAAGVAKKILNLNHYDHISWNEISILYRTNAQSRTFEEAFRKQDIPYRIYGGLSFYQRKEIKDMIAYFRLAVNPNDEEALKRVINYPARGIGQTSVARILDAASNNGVSVWEILSRPMYYNVGINRGTLSKIDGFVQLINSFREDLISLNAAELGKRIAKESGVVTEIFRGKTQEDVSRQENLQGLLDAMSQFVDERQEEEGEEAHILLTHYLQEISLLSNMDESDDDNEEKISLMTVHSAKGLEFRVVFIVGLEENLFPSQMATTVRELEEERRLFYVALTRAEDQCFLTYAQNRYRYGKQEFSNPSRFLNEIDDKYIKHEFSPAIGLHRRSSSSFSLDNEYDTPFSSRSPFSARESRISTQQSDRPQIRDFQRPSNSSYPSSTSQHAISTTQPPVSQTQTAAGTLVVGSRIEHSRFGQGEVIALNGTGIDAKATVRFDNVGTKQLLLRFAKFNIIN